MHFDQHWIKIFYNKICSPSQKKIYENFTNMPNSKKIKHTVQNSILKASM